jgi:hypothetical protein
MEDLTEHIDHDETFRDIEKITKPMTDFKIFRKPLKDFKID